MNFEIKGNNELIPMTRRYPNLPIKVLRRDSDVALRLIQAWDNEKDGDKVLAIYLKEHRNLSDERYWETMRIVWVICGSVNNADTFRKLMRSPRKNRYYFSTPEDAQKLRELPETFEVYRATNDENDGGLSWTVSKVYAEWYRDAYAKEKIITRTVSRKDVFAFVGRNNEYEAIIL